MTEQFSVSSELQQFLQGVGSRALTNVTWNLSFDGDAPTLPLSPTSIRRSLLFDKAFLVDGATPVTSYSCYIKNLDGTEELSTSFAREFG